MDDVVDLSVALLRKFAEFTKKLTPEQLAAVATGELKFGLLDLPAKKAQAPHFGADQVEAIRADLLAMTARKAAADYIDELKLSSDRLRALAKALGASLTGVSRKDDFRDRIVEHMVGFRLNSDAFRA